MGIFRKQSIRLLRERWGGVNEAMEELYAILNSDEPLEIDGPVTINNSTGRAPLTINQFGGDGGVVNINRRDEPPVQPPGFPPLDFGGPGNFTITIINQFGGVETGTSNDGTPPRPQPEQQGGGGFPGRVISGEGSTYQVAVYESGLAQAPVTRTVTQLQIASDATVPAGTWALVGKAGNSYFMQVATWLMDEPP
jgi:hypothetical protein